MLTYILPLLWELSAWPYWWSSSSSSFHVSVVRRSGYSVIFVVTVVLGLRYGLPLQCLSGEVNGQVGLGWRKETMQHGQPHTGRLTLNTCQLSSQLQSPRDQLLSHSSQLLSSLGRPKLHGSVKGSIPQSLLCHHTTRLKALMSSRLINNMSQETGEPSDGHGNDRQGPSRPTSPAPPSTCEEEHPPCTPGTCSTHWDEQGRRIADSRPPRPRTRSRSRSRSSSNNSLSDIVSFH